MIDREKHNKKAKDYAEKRKRKENFYYTLFIGFLFTIILIIVDFIGGILSSSIKLIVLMILMVICYILYRKWNYLTSQLIITVETSNGQFMAGGEEVKFRVSEDKFSDKVKKFFKEM